MPAQDLHLDLFFINKKILPIPSLHIYESILLVKKFICNENIFFLKNEAIRLHNTRRKSGLFVQQYSTSLGQRGASHSGIKIYDNLPIKIKHLDQFSPFKSALEAYLFDHCFYSTQDYMES